MRNMIKILQIQSNYGFCQYLFNSKVSHMIFSSCRKNLVSFSLNEFNEFLYIKPNTYVIFLTSINKLRVNVVKTCPKQLPNISTCECKNSKFM